MASRVVAVATLLVLMLAVAVQSHLHHHHHQNHGSPLSAMARLSQLEDSQVKEEMFKDLCVSFSNANSDMNPNRPSVHSQLVESIEEFIAIMTSEKGIFGSGMDLLVEKSKTVDIASTLKRVWFTSGGEPFKNEFCGGSGVQEGRRLELQFTTLTLCALDHTTDDFHKECASLDHPHIVAKHHKKKKNKTDTVLQQLVDQMWDADADDRFSVDDVVLNFGNPVNGTDDVSPNALFTSINESILQRPLYAALIDIYNQSIFHPPVCTAENATEGDRRVPLDNFLYQVTNTSVFQLAFAYLQNQSVAVDYDSFYPTLFDLWFGTYSRCDPTLGSSGWEHVFCGEKRSDIVDGQHFWVRYYLLEQAGAIDYHGYYTYDDKLIGTIQYTWDGFLKKIGGFLIRSSPAFDLSLFTVCAMTHTGAEHCRFNITDKPVYVTSYNQTCDSGTCLDTSYPIIPN